MLYRAIRFSLLYDPEIFSAKHGPLTLPTPMNLIAIAILAQLAVPLHRTLPVLAFPEHGLDDSAAYAGYATRLYRDAAGNTVQLYLDQRTGRIVNLLADAEDQSVGLSARDGSGTTVAITWGAAGASTGRSGDARVFEQQLLAHGARVYLTDVLLGSMRVERDFQYWRAHRDSLAASPFAVPEYTRLVAAMAQLPADERARELALLNARDLQQLRARLRPSMTVRRTASSWSAVVVQPALDARDTLVLELRADPRIVDARVTGDSVLLVARSGARVPFTVSITTTGRALAPLVARDIFTSGFLHFVDSAHTATHTPAAALRARWLDRQVRETELLSSQQKVMAGLPNYATYFGRDMLVTALMMRPIWRPEMSEFVVAAALRKLRADGWVSHEEAIGWQSIREAASEYATLVDEWRRASDAHRTAADSLIVRARTVLRDARRVRENYNMIDANFQLPVLAAHWLTDPAIPAARKRAFLADVSSGEPNLRLLLRELALVARLSAPYVRDPVATNLISFPRRDSTRCQSASWRDSDAGYAGGCFAMDVNALWTPHALVALKRILGALHTLGVPLDSVARTMPELGGDSPFGAYVRSPGALEHAIDVWRGARHQFLVTLSAAEVRARVAARLAALPAADRNYWESTPSTGAAEQGSLAFLTLSLDAGGRAIDIESSDPATGLFLSGTDSAAARAVGTSRGDVLRDVRTFASAYPVGLLVPRVGPVVTNDAYAPPSVWSTFEKDTYHGPRVVWGREVNLFLLGAAGLLEYGHDGPTTRPEAYASELRSALDRVHAAVDSAGFRSELWTYEIVDGRPKAVRYGTGSDVQLWSTSDLAVQFALERSRRSRITSSARRVAGPHPAR